jgi:putative acyl-CoA dehydrogenase
MPRFAADGSVNRIKLERLKDKLGNRSNGSAEVSFDRARLQARGVLRWPRRP